MIVNLNILVLNLAFGPKIYLMVQYGITTNINMYASMNFNLMVARQTTKLTNFN